MKRTLLLVPLLVTLPLSGCSFSYSSASISESSESLSESVSSISTSSSPKEELSKQKLNYRDDVANLTHSVVNSSMTGDEFPTALSRIAAQYKVSSWSQEKATYYGIGRGLKRAGIAKDEVEDLPLLSEVRSANRKAIDYILDGYKQK